MNIVHITDSMEVGGAETLIALLCSTQRRRGHDPHIHCLYGIGSVGKRLQAEGIEVTLHRPPTFTGLVNSLYRAFRRNKPDVVHCHNTTATIIAAIPARMAGVKKIVVTRHGLVGRPYSFPRELKFAIASYFCDWIVAVCEEAKCNLLAAPFACRKRIVRVYNGVAGVNVNARLPDWNTGITLLHVGRLSPIKDQESLIRAFAIARQHVPDLQLWVVGDGPLRSKLQELTRELGVDSTTQFFGEQGDVAPFYIAAHLFIMSSLSEGLPVSLLEAMSAGLPSIVTNVGGMREIAGLSDSALTVPASDHKALAEAICLRVENKAGLSDLGESARQCYQRTFTLDRMAEDYARLYQSSGTPGPPVTASYAEPGPEVTGL